MIYGSTELREKEAQKKIDIYRELATFYPAIVPIIKKFDGKVYNKRFSEALRAAGAYSEKRNNNIYIYGNVQNCGIWSRILARVSLDDCVDGKRINADLLIKDAADTRAGFLRRAYEIETALDKMDIVAAQIKQLDKQLKAILAPIPYEIQDIYGVNVRITR